MKKLFYSCLIATLHLSQIGATSPNVMTIEELLILEEDAFCSDATCECNHIDKAILRLPIPSQISCNEMHSYAQQLVQRCLPKHKSSRPARIKGHDDAQILVHKLCTQLTLQLNKSKLPSIERTHLDYILKTAMSKLIEPVNAPLRELVIHVDTCINQYFKDCSCNISDIPSIMKKEFAERRSNLLFKLKDTFEQKNEYPAQKDIVDGIEKAFQDFIKRAQHIHLTEWINGELVNLKHQDPGKNPGSYLKPNPGNAVLRKRLKFLDKKTTA